MPTRFPEGNFQTFHHFFMPAATGSGHAATSQPDRTRDLEPLIGNTPLLAIRFRFQGAARVVFAKSENLNMTGSVKDRMALEILRRGYCTGALQPGGLIVEATSGNTGISFAAIGRALGHPVAIFIPSWMSEERLALLRSLGAELHLVTPEQGGFVGSIEQADRLAPANRGRLPAAPVLQWGQLRCA